MIKLNKPLAVFDLETTGTKVATDRIVEISIVKVLPGGDKESITRRINPGIPIPAEASAVHGIYDEDVKDKPLFKDAAHELKNYIADSDLAGYNCLNFDVPLLVEEFLRVGVDFDVKSRRIVDVQNIFHKMEQRTLSAAYKFYCQKNLENAHSAEADTLATYEVLEAQLERYPELQNDVKFLHDFSIRNRNVDFAGHIIFNEKNEEVINFGKHKGKVVTAVLSAEPSYYNWMMTADFPQYTKKVLTEIRLRSFNK
ncbi:MAG: exonuclease domain-containing protein [Bacteroidia bacterium]